MIYTDGIHLITDGDLEELHEFAESIGLKRKWFQNKTRRPHYDLVAVIKVKMAVKSGAKLITPQDVVRILSGKEQENDFSTWESMLSYRASVPTLKKFTDKYSRKKRID